MADWTNEEIQTLKEIYGTLPNKVLAKQMGRSKQSLQWKAFELKITTLKVAQPRHCIECGNVLGRSSWNAPRVQRCFSCGVKHNVGENANRWKGGVAALRSIIHTLLKPVWIDPIMRKSNYTCQFCHNRGGDMEVHHVYPYARLRDEVIKENPLVNLRTFEGKKEMALKIVAVHKLEYGICLCVPCHTKIHSEKRDELTGKPKSLGGAMGNQQVSLGNVMQFVPRKLQRLTLEDSQSNNSDTSVPNPLSEGYDIVCSYAMSVGSKA